ncbi:MAG: peptidylprolyl isomerase [Candidatus Obscuribacterales bacterium]|nr:peptidylprolyl isomerase [Candidatus Obscuribacterales bacterium]
MAEDISATPIATDGSITVTLKELLQELKYQTSWHLINDAWKRHLLAELFNKHGIEVSEDEVFEYMDKFREENDLYTEDDISRWLETNKLSDDEFYEYCRHECRLKALKAGLFPEEKLAQYFAGSKLKLDTVELYHLITPTQDMAEEILAQIKEGADFFSMAKRFSTEKETKHACGYMGRVSRCQLRAEIEAAVFGAKQGDVVGPFKGTRGYHLYLVDELCPAKLDAQNKELIKDELFSIFFKSILDGRALSYPGLES